MTDTADLGTDVLVVGAGPAGLAAAAAADVAGLDVTVIDENPLAGGQIWRQAFADAGTTGEQARLPARARFLCSAVCVGFGRSGEAVVDAGGHLFSIRSRAVVLATGAYERVVPVPGWTLPGVMTAGAAQTLLKGSGMFPYRRVVVAGTGPLLLAAATQLLAAGAAVAAVVEAVRPGPGDMRQVPGLLAGGRLVLDGAGYLLRLAGARVPLLTGHAVEEISGDDGVGGVVVRRVHADWSPSPRHAPREIACDAVLLSHGFSSSVELAAQAGLRLLWDAQRRSWRPWRTETFETSQPLVFAVGDCAGVGGAQIATAEGTLAGLTVAGRLTGHGGESRRTPKLRRQLARLERFRRAMDGLSRVPPGALSRVRPDTIVCRCQGTTAGELRRAVDGGVSTLHAVKLWSRAGMGRCQGRICGPNISDLLHDLCGQPPGLDAPRVRFPVRPVAAGAIAGWRTTTRE
jgi:NADPH-dependent 2,4-dienoyl-CoA reductase/sulfur reductase-like enzyme